MSIHLHKSLDEVKKLLLTMGGMVEELIEKASLAYQNNDKKLAQKVIDGDDAVDRLELRIDDECLKLLALHQPVAEDLRFIATVLKINNDLERMADLAVNIAHRCLEISDEVDFRSKRYFPLMSEAVIKMVRDVLSSFVNRDPLGARRVVRRDDEVDRWHETVFEETKELMEADNSKVELGVQVLWVSRNYERIADHTTNIAEDIVYMVEGEVIRHGNWSDTAPRDRKSRHLDA